MKYPPPRGPRTVAKQGREKQPPPPPHKVVRKLIHGQMVDVKVYEPWWALGDQREKQALGLKPNPFNRDRGDTLELKAKLAAKKT